MNMIYYIIMLKQKLKSLTFNIVHNSNNYNNAYEQALKHATKINGII